MLACHARANGSIPLCCTMKKFTQEELEAAYEQMQRERADDAHAANSAAHWVNDQLALGTVRYQDPRRNVGIYTGGASPEKTQYVIVCVYETYGPHLEDWQKKLDVVPWAKKNDEWVYGFRLNTPFYDVETPFGTFKLTFEYFDNHCTGY
jgi:hypothetical protein